MYGRLYLVSPHTHFRLIAIVTFTVASALVLSLWDTALTLDLEVAYIWPRKWDLTQAVFFLNRYGITGILLYVNYSTSLPSVRSLALHGVSSPSMG